MTYELKCKSCGDVRTLDAREIKQADAHELITYCYNCGELWSMDDGKLVITVDRPQEAV